ncbi:MAG: glycoside hydrolase family 65 protein [Candidatus Binatia bacterium]
MSTWTIVYDDFIPEQERLREALCTLGNGYFATRGAAEESTANATHYPGTYVAGGYNRLQTAIAGHVIENEDLVNCPNWLCLSWRPEGGEWFDMQKVALLSYQQQLHLKAGLLTRTLRIRDGEGRETTLQSRRFVHLVESHMAGLSLTLTAENWSGRIHVRSALDGRVTNSGVERYQRLNSKHLQPLRTGEGDDRGIVLVVQTNQSHLQIAEAACLHVFGDDARVETERHTITQPEYVAQELTCDLAQGQPLTVEKLVALYTSRDPAMSECELEATKAITRARRFRELEQSHAVAWEQLWAQCDIAVADAPRTQSLLRLHIFHLLQTVSPNTVDLDVGVPPRGWHGEAYRGHILWDELFIFPFLNLRLPELTRTLLLYRYRRLPEARWAAREAGYRGAMFPWQSGSNGREESQAIHLNPQSGRWIPDHSRLQRHVNAAIAYNVWQYYQATNDREFMTHYGAEMLLEIARFWASIASYNQELDRYEIHGVMGPDEYHDAYPGAEQPGLNNNAYTNIMAVWTIQRALDVFDTLAPDRHAALWQRLNLSDEELGCWVDISRKMRLVFHDDGILSQFEGYDALEEFDWEGYRRTYDDIHRLDRILEAEGDTPNRYKVSKQADVLMLFYLFSAEELGDLITQLGYPFTYETIPKNVAYYAQRTAHGSTLSRLVHSWVLARSDRQRSWQLFTEALESDISDIQGGTTAEGIHLGAMAGTIDLMQRCYTGLEMREDVLWLNPCLPTPLRELAFRIRYRSHWLDLQVSHDTLTVAFKRGWAQTVEIGFKDQVYEFAQGESKTFRLS